MPSANNDDFLTRVQLTAVDLLEASTYFAPLNGQRIPITSEVKEDVVQRVSASNPAGLICIVALGDCRFEQGGGSRATASLQLIVRVRETVSLNRSSSGTRENALRVAQMVALTLDRQRAAMSTDTIPVSMGGNFVLESIEPAAADKDGIQAWHVTFRITGGGLCTFTRWADPVPVGSP